MKAQRITVSLTRFAEPNDLLFQTLASLARQSRSGIEVLMLDQKNDAQTRAYCKKLSNRRVTFAYLVMPPRGLSFARNHAVAKCSTDVLLFIDSDALADRAWAQRLADGFSRPDVAIVGGSVLPSWHRAPLFVTRSRIVCEQYSLVDFGRRTMDVDKVVGANFGLNLRLLGRKNLFDTGLGRKNGRLLGGEETRLCERSRDRGLAVRYIGAAIVHHQILPERIRYAWLLRRLYYAGLSRALRGGRPSAFHKGPDYWTYLLLPFILPPYACGYFYGLLFEKRPRR
jgi:glucosyl-dolichyl phosphate glucuronosyltransferase